MENTQIQYQARYKIYHLILEHTSPKRGVLVILIGSLTSKSALLSFTLLSACPPTTPHHPQARDTHHCQFSIFEK